jgi:hypothetical protein
MALSSLAFKLTSFNISYEATKLKHRLWWLFMPGTEIVVKWPMGWTEPDDLGNSVESADPNDHMRPWLAANVGRQCWDWNWDIKQRGDETMLLIKFRWGKGAHAMHARMLWG